MKLSNSLNEIYKDLVLKPHQGAKRLKITIKNGQLVLTVPPRATTKQIQSFLLSASDWVQEHFMPQVEARLSTEQPLSIDIPLLNQTFEVCCDNTISSVADEGLLLEQGQQLLVTELLKEQLLQKWLIEKAKVYLPPRLALLAKTHQFTYQKCTIRKTTTRWGSCTSEKNISLNAGLLLLPLSLIDYVLLHELCHTIHMNHSEYFWNLVSEVCPSYADDLQQLRKITMPNWWLVKL